MLRFTLPLLLALSVTSVQAQKAGQLTLDLIYDPDKKVDFDGDPPTIVAWLKDNQHYVERKGGEDKVTQLLQVDARTGKSRPLYDTRRIQSAFQSLKLSSEKAQKLVKEGDFEFSPDEKAVLINYDGDLFYYRFADQTALQLTATEAEEKEAAFSPDGKKIGFVRDSDLYIVEIGEANEKRLTSGGSKDLLNGLLDWVYQEEIYGRGDFKAYWWSPDSSKIVFLQLDQSKVPDYTVIDHLPQHLKKELTHYPKAGDPNATARLGVVSAQGGETRWLDLSKYKPEDLLVVRVGWTPDSRQVVFQAQNKEQTWLDLNFAASESGQVKTVVQEKSPAWVEVSEEPEWLDDGSFLWISERDGWKHLYHYSAEGKPIRTLTSGQWEVREHHGVDEKNGWVYFSGTKRSSLDLDVYRVRLEGSEPERLTAKAGSHRARFNEDLSLFIDTWSDMDTPPEVRLYNSGGTEVREIYRMKDNRLPDFRLGKVTKMQVKARDGFEMEAILIQPPDFDPSQKYPVMSHTYSGPHAPRVVNRWGGDTYLWHQYLAQQGYVIWILDNRTASGKGARSSWPLHRNFGELELKDLEDGLKWLKGQPWVDGSRIGLWGWSFGGYMTSYALTHSDQFKIGIAGAPVTDWSLYDSIYTERYMGTPQSNPKGYEKSSVLKAAGNLSGKLLLLHGTTDDNVHLQNTIQFIYQLQKAGKQFEMMLYPQSRHGIRNPLQVKHMRTLMTNFIVENL